MCVHLYLDGQAVMHTGYDHTVDWWALGVLLFHFLAGVTPFMAESKVCRFRLSGREGGRDDFQYPSRPILLLRMMSTAFNSSSSLSH